MTKGKGDVVTGLNNKLQAASLGLIAARKSSRGAAYLGR